MHILIQEAESLNQHSINLEESLRIIEGELIRVLDKRQSMVTTLCKSVVTSGGKRLRPLLVMCTGLCFGEIKREIIDTAVAVELVHTASLVHDDVIDNSFTRRGNPTINANWGNQLATLAGDYLFAEAFSIMASKNLINSMTYVVDAIQEMCDGEIEQATDNFNWEVTQDQYNSRIFKKTGALLTAACKAGARLGGATEEELISIERYGMNIGRGFQIIDDILDFTGDVASVGKPLGCDLLAGNITLPIIYLLERDLINEEVKIAFSRGTATSMDVGRIKELLVSSGALQQAMDTAANCVKQAKESIAFIKPSPYRDVLNQIADKIISRDR